MNTATIKTLKDGILNAISKALDDKNTISKIAEMLEENLAANESDDNQAKQTEMTLQPKIKITYAAPGDFLIEAKVPAKRIETITGEGEVDLTEQDDDEPELPNVNPDGEESEEESEDNEEEQND